MFATATEFKKIVSNLYVLPDYVPSLYFLYEWKPLINGKGDAYKEYIASSYASPPPSYTLSLPILFVWENGGKGNRLKL